MDSSTLTSTVPMSTSEFLKSHPEGNTISPLPSSLRSGLISIAVFSFISFILTSTLFIYLSYKLLAWHLQKKSQATVIKKNLPDPQPVTDFTFEDSAFGPQGQSSEAAHDQNLRRLRDVKNRPPNQFLILVYNLILADMHQGAAFMLSATWLQRNGIFAQSPTCFVQGFFDSNGDLSSSLFITAIAIHTYLSVVKGYRPSQTALYTIIIGIWVFVYCLSVIPILVTHREDKGGYYVRAGAWCWISEAYESLRLFTHYIFIFASLATTSALYTAIFLALRRQVLERADRATENGSKIRMSHNPAFLIYPLIYVSCTLPLAVGRIATMAGAHVPIGYYCFAGTMLACNGAFDCILFGTTRHAIVFGSKDEVDIDDTGLDTFAFMRTPAGNYGNTIWIQGGNMRLEGNTGVGGWWHRLGGSGGSGAGASHNRPRSVSQETLHGAAAGELAIQMDVVTSMTVEVQPGKDRDPRYPDPLSSASTSLKSGGV